MQPAAGRYTYVNLGETKEEVVNAKAKSSMYEFVPSRSKCNIVFFGHSTTGKSSTINNLLSKSDLITHRANPRPYGQTGQYTLKFNGYRVSDQVCLFGFNYSDVRFRDLLQGKFVQGQSHDNPNSSQESDETSVDMVVFVVDDGFIAKPKSYDEGIASFVKIVQERKLPYCFAVTHVDDLMQKDGVNIRDFQRQEDVAFNKVLINPNYKKIVRKIRLLFPGVGVYPICNEESDSEFRTGVCQYFAEKFCFNLTKVIESFYYVSTVRTKKEYGFDGEDIFRESLVKPFAKVVDPSTRGLAKSTSLLETSFPIAELFKTVLQFGEKKYRMYALINTRRGENLCCLGLYDFFRAECFQLVSFDLDLYHNVKDCIEKENSNLFYQFLEGSSERFTRSSDKCSPQTKFVFLAMGAGSVKLLLNKKEFSLFEKDLENFIQSEKRISKRLVKSKADQFAHFLKESLVREQSRNNLERKKLIDGVTTQVNALTTSNKALEVTLRKGIYNSSILNTSQRTELKRACGFGSKYRVLFRASEEGFASSTFHRKCDKLQHTLVIVKTDQGRVFGGYSTCSWGGGGYKKAPGSWLFNFGNDGKIVQFFENATDFSILCAPGAGPCFGKTDLHVSNNAHQGSTSRTSLTKSYQNRGMGTKVLNAGTEYFKIVEYEVFEPPFDVSSTLTREQFDAVRVAFKIPMKQSIKVHYRASRDGYGIETFHELCDELCESIIVVKSGSGNCFGGICTTEWGGGGKFVSAKGCMLFGFNSNGSIEKFPCKDDSKAILRETPTSQPGISFGEYDLFISDMCNTNRNSCSNLGTSYNDKGKGKRFFDKFGTHFVVVDYEVLTLIGGMGVNKAALKSFSKILSVSQFKEIRRVFRGFDMKKQLLYRASQHGKSSSQFHSKCNNKGRTFVIIQSNTDRVFGGLATQTWAGSGYTKAPGAWLFGFQNDGKIVQFHTNLNGNDMYRHTSHGSTFGGNHDIYISSNFSGCSTSLGHSYPHTQSSASFLNGGTSSFSVKELEVYQV